MSDIESDPHFKNKAATITAIALGAAAIAEGYRTYEKHPTKGRSLMVGGALTALWVGLHNHGHIQRGINPDVYKKDLIKPFFGLGVNSEKMQPDTAAKDEDNNLVSLPVEPQENSEGLV